MQSFAEGSVRARAVALSLFTAAAMLAPAARAAEPEPLWSIGSGVTYNFGLPGALSCCYSSNAPPIVTAPQPLLGAERRLGPSLWLLVNLSAGFSTTSSNNPVPATYYSLVTSSTSYSLGAFAGARQVFTDPGAPVAVSAFGGLTLGYAAASQEVATNNGTGGGTVSSKPSAHQLAVGLAGGLSVDRLLSERLTLRLSARLLSAAYARGSGKVDEPAPAQDTSGFGAALAFDPSIELRLAF